MKAEPSMLQLCMVHTNRLNERANLDLSFPNMTKDCKLSFSNSNDKRMCWNLSLGPLFDLPVNNALIISFFGRYSIGKTTIMKKLSPSIDRINPKIGITATTKGLDFYSYKEGSRSIVVVDTEGMNSPLSVVSPEDNSFAIQKALLKEFMVREIVQDISDIIFYVTRQYSLEDELSINKLIEQNQTRPIFVIHNPFTIKTNTELDVYIEQLKNGDAVAYIEYVKGLKKSSRMDPLLFNGKHVKHYFFMDDSTSVGKDYNSRSVRGIVGELKSITKTRPNGTFGDILKSTFISNLQKILNVNLKEGRLENVNSDGFWLESSDECDVPLNWINPYPTLSSKQSKMRAFPTKDKTDMGRIFSFEACLDVKFVKIFLCKTHLKIELNYIDNEKQLNLDTEIDESSNIKVEDKKELDLNVDVLPIENKSLEIVKRPNETLSGVVSWIKNGRLFIFLPCDSKSAKKYGERLIEKMEKNGAINIDALDEDD